jgi:outer membrane protein assembly factor BamB
MKKKLIYKTTLAIGIITLFFLSSIIPIVIGKNIRLTYKEQIVTDLNIHNSSKFYNCYNVDEIPRDIKQTFDDKSKEYYIDSDSILNSSEEPINPLKGPLDSLWPMYCHDTRHTGRSPYDTTNTWGEIWRFGIYGQAGGPAIDENGTIYIGGQNFNAIYPNGTLKWGYGLNGWIDGTCPTIDENGIIYLGTVYGDPSYLYALYPNGTLKWKYSVGGVSSIFSSSAIGDDGTIYFGYGGDYPPTGYIMALFPNGTLKWEFQTSHFVYSSPAISDDGTIYCGSHDKHLYALHPNNGTVKWKYKTSYWIRTSPCIGDDGTIYVVSLDNYLHALYPNGTLKWKIDVGAGTSPTIGWDGTIYCGYAKLFAINPDGFVKWKFDVGGTIRGGTPCNSIDGTIYVGTSDGGQLIAINPDGTEKWRVKIGTCESPPAISKDGTVYVGSDNNRLYAFGIVELQADANGPYYGLINEPVQFNGKGMGGYSPFSYHWDFGDGHTSEEQNPTHTYTEVGDYNVTLTVTDNTSNSSVDYTSAWIQDGNSPPDKPTIDGVKYGQYFEEYDYSFSATDPDGTPIWYYIDWDDPYSDNPGWIGPSPSGGKIVRTHWWGRGTYIIRCKAKDPYGEEGPWGELKVIMPRNKETSYSLFLQLLERFPLIKQLFTIFS